MQVLDVFVGVPNPQNKKVFVQPEIAGVHSGDDVLWRIFSLDPAASHVEIDFQDPEDEFFASNTSPTRSKKCIARLNGAAAGKQATIHGDAPRPGGSKGARSAKYWVRAYDGEPEKGGKLVGDLDPIIVTVDP